MLYASYSCYIHTVNTSYPVHVRWGNNLQTKILPCTHNHHIKQKLAMWLSYFHHLKCCWKVQPITFFVDGTCNNSDIRLVEGRNSLEGRVEVCHQGQWGTVCGYSWDFRAASVACRQLGLTSECKLLTS